MRKQNPFNSLVTKKPADKDQEEKFVMATMATSNRAIRVKKKSGVQTTTFRLNTEDHIALRQLAFRDGQFMNELVVTALREYCEKRGVRLTTLV